MKKHQSGYPNGTIYEMRYIRNDIKRKAPLSGELAAKLTERSFSAAAANGFPYEGKLSPEATDEVGGVV